MNGWIAIIAIATAVILTGPGDYQDAVLLHKSMCEHAPQPEFCKDEIK